MNPVAPIRSQQTRCAPAARPGRASKRGPPVLSIVLALTAAMVLVGLVLQVIAHLLAGAL